MTLSSSFTLSLSALVAVAGLASANPIDTSAALTSRELVGLQRRDDTNSSSSFVLQDNLVSSVAPSLPPVISVNGLLHRPRLGTS